MNILSYHGERGKFLEQRWAFCIAVRAISRSLAEALKTVGKRFEFVELYDNRDSFKKEILATIGLDLNGYVLDDCAIDY